MQQFVEQAKHNEKFHVSLCQTYSTQFFDWKLTCLFYSAYHLLKALASLKRIDIGNSHVEINQNINPKFRNRKLQIKDAAFEAYDALWLYSWYSRYDGFVDFDTWQIIKENDHKDAIYRYEYFKKYITGLGVQLN